MSNFLSKAYIEGFVKQCYDQGLSSEQTHTLLTAHQRERMYETDKDFRDGYDAVIKQATANHG